MKHFCMDTREGVKSNERKFETVRKCFKRGTENEL